MTESTELPQILIKGGCIVNNDYSFCEDVLIEGAKIKQIGSNLTAPGASVIEAKGLLLMPGGIDPRTRFEAPYFGTFSVDDFYHGTRSALAGGTTMIIDYVFPKRDESLLDAYSKRRELADAKVCCDYSLHVLLGGWNDKICEEMTVIAQDKGVGSFAISLADSELNDSDLYHCFDQCQKLGALLQVHAENGNVIKEKIKEVISEGILGPEGHLLSRPEESETEAVYRAIAIAKEARAPVYVMKVMNRSAADIIANARKKGDVVYGECIAAALGTNGFHVFNNCWRHAASHVTSPPLRPDLQTARLLMDFLANGELQLTASDNCTFNVDQKAIGKDDFRKIPSGVNGVEDRMSIIWERGVVSGKMDFNQFVAVTSTTAAKIFNLYPQKGRIAVGSDADIVLWDPNAERMISSKTHHQNCDFNIFEGQICHGSPAYVISNGTIVVDNDGLHVSQGSGRYIPVACNNPVVYGRLRDREKFSKLAPVVREPYDGPVYEKPLITENDTNPITPDRTFHFESSNSAQENCTQGEETNNMKRPSGYRVNQPPGGKTSQLW